MAECQNVSDFCARKGMRLGLYGRSSGSVKPLCEINVKVWAHSRMSERQNFFLSETGLG